MRFNSLILSSLFSVSAYGISSTGIAYTADYYTNNMYSVDLQTGTVTTFSSILPASSAINDIAILNSTTGYALDSNGSNVYSVNLQTGATRLVTSTPINTSYDDLYALALADSSTAYVVGVDSNKIFTLDLQTGASSLLTTLPGTCGPTDIVMGNNSTAYVVGYLDNNVYEVNLQTGAYQIVTPSPVGSPSDPALYGIALLDNSTAYVVGNNNSNVYSVDLETGSFSLVTTVDPSNSPALENMGISGTTAYTVNDYGAQFYAVNLLNGTYTTLALLPYATSAVAVGLVMQIGTDPITGNNLKLVNYLNDNAPLQTIRLLALLPQAQLAPALISTAPTRNAFATYASQNGFLASSQVVADHGRQRRFHQRQRMEEKIAAADIPAEELTANASKKAVKKVPPCKQEPYTGWIAPFGEYAREKSQSQTPEFNMGVGGVVTGFDFNNMGPHVLGIGAAYVYTHINEKQNLGSGNVNQGFLTVYGTLNAHKWYVDLGIWGGYYNISNKRHISFTFFDETARSSTNGWQLAPHFEVGYDGFRLHDCGVKWFGVEPFLMADYVANWEKGFKEHGAGLLNMGQKGRFSSLFRGETGLRIHETATCSWGRIVFTEKASYAYQKAFKTGRINAFLVGSPGSFTVSTLGTAQNLGVGEFSMLFIFGSQNSTYLDLRYQGEFGSRYQSHQGVLEIGKDF